MTSMDFATLPPEVNSGLMYMGPGAGPMVAAAAAWDGLAAELSSATASYQEVVTDLTGEAWQGPSATAMAAAAAPYLAWLGATAGQAEQAANQARAAAAAYEVAFAATVPPPVVAANRTLLASLVANNVFGQNSSAIAANQAEYAQMWAQDASAMYGYAGSAAAATRLTPFTAPQQNSNPAGQANQATGPATGNPGSAAAAPGAVPGPVQALIDGYLQLAGMPLFSSMNQLAGSFGVSMVNFGGMPFVSSAVQVLQLMGMLNAGGANGAIWGAEAAAAALPAVAISQTSPAVLGATLAGSAAPVSAGLGGTASVGGLSVPHSWAAASGAMGAGPAGSALAGTALPGTNLAGLPASAALRSGGWSGDRPLIAGVVNAPRSGLSNSRFKYRAGLGSAAGGKPGGDKETSGRWLQPSRRVAETASALSKYERRELEGLRAAVGDLTTERDAAARLIRKELRS